jgi:superfamily II DNA/RNA helicase
MFVHRIGRTARAGKTGHSLTLLCPSEETYIPFLIRRQVIYIICFLSIFYINNDFD